MKGKAIILLVLMNASIAFGQSVIFLHHSTGGNVYSEGDVPEYISDYNFNNETNIQVSDRAYPNTPYPWNNYPYDFWNLWVNSGCNDASMGTECLESLGAAKDIIIWKHCYPGAGLSADESEGDITSSSKTIPNYKLQYRALREKMAAMPNNQFIIWTLAPLHRLSTSANQAIRAAEFVNWVKNEWLSEDGKSYPNIHVFDFFGIMAEQEASPVHGFQYCLKYDYERSHESGDSHPNTLANETAGPAFAQFIIDVATGKTVSSGMNLVPAQEMKIYPNPTSGTVYFSENIPDNSWTQVYNMVGERVLDIQVMNRQIDLSELRNGVYFLKTDEQVFRIVKK